MKAIITDNLSKRYAQEICTCYGLIDEGVLLATGHIDELRAMVRPGLTVTIRADRFPEEFGQPETADGVCEINVFSEDEIPSIVRRVVEAGGNIRHVSARELSLEEIYLALLERRKGKKEAV